jgi:molybdenum cofactor biosynthesis enzyme MoaA
MPFVTFPLLKACNFKCEYCGEGGELSASMKAQWDPDVLVDRIFAAHRLGVRKFRITGGEPFLFKGIDKVLLTLNDIGCYTHVNTNGSYLRRHEDLLRRLEPNFHFAISLDSTDRQNFRVISKTKGYYKATMDGIDLIARLGRLLRLNMVVTKYNVHEIGNMIDFCRAKNCNLKLLDVVSVPLPFGDRRDLHVSLKGVEEQLRGMADRIEFHEYARAFGTPCQVYHVDGVAVTVKSTWNGSRYDLNGICNGCEYYPCHEGLYDIFALPDGRVVGCRWSDTSVAATNSNEDRYNAEGDFKEALVKMAKVFQRAEYVLRDQNASMVPRPYFVTHSLEVKRAKRRSAHLEEGHP